jgi:hypothetical protein
MPDWSCANRGFYVPRANPAIAIHEELTVSKHRERIAFPEKSSLLPVGGMDFFYWGIPKPFENIFEKFSFCFARSTFPACVVCGKGNGISPLSSSQEMR